MLVTDDGGMLVTLLARLGNLSRSGVRFLENKGVLKPRYNESGYRVFAAEDFMRLRLFQSLRAMGLSQKESLEAAAQQPRERQASIRAVRERLMQEHEHRLHLIDAELAKAEQALGDKKPTIAERPAFLILPDCGTFLESDPLAQESPDSTEVVREGIRWWNELPDVSFGLLFSGKTGDGINVGRYAIMEVPGGDPSRSVGLPAGATFLAPCTCMRVVVERSSGIGPDPLSELTLELDRAAVELGIEVTLDGAVARETYLQFEGNGLSVRSEVWAPVLK